MVSMKARKAAAMAVQIAIVCAKNRNILLGQEHEGAPSGCQPPVKHGGEIPHTQETSCLAALNLYFDVKEGRLFSSLLPLYLSGKHFIKLAIVLGNIVSEIL